MHDETFIHLLKYLLLFLDFNYNRVSNYMKKDKIYFEMQVGSVLV